MRSLILFSLIAFAWAQYGLPLPPAPIQAQPMYAAPALQPTFYLPRPMVVHYRPFYRHWWSSESHEHRPHRRRRVQSEEQQTTPHPQGRGCAQCRRFRPINGETKIRYSFLKNGCLQAFVMCPSQSTDHVYQVLGYTRRGEEMMLARGIGGGVPLDCNGRKEWIGVSWNGTEKVTVYDVKCEIYTPPPTTTPVPIRFVKADAAYDYEPGPEPDYSSEHAPHDENGEDREENAKADYSGPEIEESREGEDYAAEE
ncbi:hypothetical protein ANCCAN_00098 [Ancylostoma caninum]|uniref:Uncharacterized protein n=1 Tax=Ancylostoma caninum TaxID=29170 RepID=A0A368HAI6_ANCCA|nr:hypothetical protein ANCCAN_00098 [Ancylostoma caninum]